MGGLVELDRALGILAEHAVDDTDEGEGSQQGDPSVPTSRPSVTELAVP